MEVRDGLHGETLVWIMQEFSNNMQATDEMSKAVKMLEAMLEDVDGVVDANQPAAQHNGLNAQSTSGNH